MRVSLLLSVVRVLIMPGAVDRERTVASVANATITPQAVVIDRAGEIRYRGRIDNLYAALGKTRQQVTSHDLRDALDAVLSGRQVPNPETEALGCFIVDPASLRTHHHEYRGLPSSAAGDLQDQKRGTLSRDLGGSAEPRQHTRSTHS